jgi:hypothetical protein
MTAMLVAKATSVGARREGSRSARSVPFHVPTAVPFTLRKSAPVDHCSGDSSPNWDGTPAQSSGTPGHRQVGAATDHCEEQGGVS